jgi:glycerophosphoryl diester phosphodiesterase
VIVETLSSKDLYKYPLLKNGEKIPTLKETLALINGKVPLLIELKFENEFDEKQADAVLAELENYPYSDMIALQSFHPKAVKYLKERTGKYSVGFLASHSVTSNKWTAYLLRSLALFSWMKGDFISYDINYLPNRYVTKRKKQGYQLLAWTINSQEKLDKALSVADNVIFEKIKV